MIEGITPLFKSIQQVLRDLAAFVVGDWLNVEGIEAGRVGFAPEVVKATVSMIVRI